MIIEYFHPTENLPWLPKFPKGTVRVHGDTHTRQCSICGVCASGHYRKIQLEINTGRAPGSTDGRYSHPRCKRCRANDRRFHDDGIGTPRECVNAQCVRPIVDPNLGLCQKHVDVLVSQRMKGPTNHRGPSISAEH